MDYLIPRKTRHQSGKIALPLPLTAGQEAPRRGHVAWDPIHAKRAEEVSPQRRGVISGCQGLGQTKGVRLLCGAGFLLG